jgi:type I restriction enzyme S subunit
MDAVSQGVVKWRTVPLSEVCLFKPSKRICRDQLADDIEVSFVPMNDLGELAKYLKPKSVRKFAEVVKAYTYFADGDVLCAKITPCFENGKLGIARDLKNGVGFGSSEFVVMRSKAELLPEFLYYYLSRDAFREAGIRLMSGAVGHKRAPKEYFENLLIPLPPLDEQKRIVAVLDQAFAGLDRARAHADDNLADAQKLFESTVDTLLSHNRIGWRDGRFEDVVGEVYTGPFGSLLHKNDYVENGIPIVNPSNIIAGAIQPNWTKSVSKKAATRLASYELQAGDFVIGRRGEMGRCAPVLPHMDGWLCGTGSFIIRPKSGVSSEFVAYLMRTPTMVAKLTSIATGATMPNLSNRAIAGMHFELPTYEAQLSLLRTIKNLEKKVSSLRSSYDLKCSEIADLRQSILQKAFAGELV